MKIDLAYLTRFLEETGYFQNYLTFGEGNIRPWDWERTSRFLTGRSKLVWDALLCGKAVSRAQLEKTISKKILPPLLDRGLCHASQAKVSFGSNALVNAGSSAFFVSRASMAEGYFGEDSRILVSLRPHLPEGRVLSLNSGTGAEILGFAPASHVEVEVEAEPSIQPYITTNLELNGFGQRARMISAAPQNVAGPYDLIMARIPSFVEFAGITFPALLGGGQTGNVKWEELLRRAHRGLSDSGRLVFIGIYYGGKESNLVSERLKNLFEDQGLSVSINFGAKLAMELGIPLFNQMLSIAELCGKKTRMELLPVFEKELESRGISHAYLVKGIAWRSRRGAPGSILDLTPHYYGTWLT